MSDSLLGAIIVTVATGALFMAVQTAEKAFRTAGKYPPTNFEIDILGKAGYSSKKDRNTIKADLASFETTYSK